MKHKDEVFLYLNGSDIIGLSETWLTSSVNNPLLFINGFKSIRQDREGGKRGGGLIFYMKEDIAPFVTIIDEVLHSDSVSEEIWIVLHKPGWKKFIIGLVYRPPSGKYDTFKERLGHTLERLSCNYNLASTEIVIMGDFNIDFSKTNSPPRTQFMSIIKDYGLRQLIKNPTRVTNKSSIIDLIFTNIKADLYKYYCLWPF